MKLVSVVIPAYNAEGYIEDCVRSILDQTYQNVEIIVVNDGSTDGTARILERLASEHACVQVITQQNAGVSAARNTALARARGDFVTMVDADDDMPSTALADMVSLMTDDVDMVIGSHYEVKLTRKKHIEKKAYFKAEELEARFRQFDPMIWFPWAKMFRRSVIAENGLGYDTAITYGEDHIFNLQFAKAMRGAAVSTDKPVYNYYYFHGGLCAKYYPNMNALQRYVLDGLIRFFGTVDELPAAYKTHYVGCYLTGCMDYYIAWCRGSEAAARIEESFAIYADLLDDAVMDAFFDSRQRELIAAGDYRRLVRDYTRKNPKKTLWRKCKRNVRRVLEKLEKIRKKRK